MFYAMVFLLLGSSGTPVDWSEAVPEFRDFHRRIWAGEVNLAGNRMKTVFGRVHLQKLLSTPQAQFNEAVTIVSEPTACRKARDS